MIKGYIKKEILYKMVNEKLTELGITHNDYPLDARAIAESLKPNLCVEYHQFPTNKMGGILYKGEKVSSMALNTLRSEKGQNFDCMHELFHYWFHPPGSMLCVDNNYIHQNSGIEWQANEGAAQGLMPQELFIRKYMELEGNVSMMSDFFIVGEQSIEFRINNLKISRIQPKNIEDIGVLSYQDKLQSKEKLLIKVPKLLKPDDKASYCPHCNNIEVSLNKYCKICGNLVKQLKVGFNGKRYKIDITIDDNGRSIVCPWCGKLSTKSGDLHCKSCGAFLYQKCTNLACGCIPDSNARYCPTCGSKTTFNTHGILLEWFF